MKPEAQRRGQTLLLGDIHLGTRGPQEERQGAMEATLAVCCLASSGWLTGVAGWGPGRPLSTRRG